MKKSAFFSCLIFSFLIFNCAKQTAQDHFRKGFAYQDREDYDSAAVEYQKAVKLDSTYVQAYLNLGVVYTKKGMYDEAIGSYQQVIRYVPLHAKAYYNLGYAYVLKGDKQKAQEQYDQLKSLDLELAQKLKEAME